MNLSTYLDDYKSLNDRNWDGYNADPITKETLEYASKIIDNIPETFGLPDVAPGSNGSIALEWNPTIGCARKIFFDIGPGEEWSAFWRYRDERFDHIAAKGYDHNTKKDLETLFIGLSKYELNDSTA